MAMSDWFLKLVQPFVLKQAAVLARNLAIFLVGLLVAGLGRFSIALDPSEVVGLQTALVTIFVGLVSWAMTSHFQLSKKADTLDKVAAAVTNPALAGQPITVNFGNDTWHPLMPLPVEVLPLPPISEGIQAAVQQRPKEPQ